MSTSLAKIAAARKALLEASSFEDVLKIADMAKAIRVLAKSAGESLEAQNQAARIRLEALRRAGVMLRESAESGEREGRGGDRTAKSHAATLNDLGITKSDSSRWQKLAAIPDDEFAAFCDGQDCDGKEITQQGLLKIAKRQKAKPRPHRPVSSGDAFVVSSLDEVQQAFACIYADPPWRYGNQGTRACTDDHYQTMTVADICAMDVQSAAASDCFLHLWTTNAFLFDAKEVMESWGFTYKSCFIWAKPQIGMGNYWRVSHEFLLLGIRGKPEWKDRTLRSWGEFPRTKHSAKPGQIRNWIEQACDGPYLEMFGREAVSGWTVLGNQVEEVLF